MGCPYRDILSAKKNVQMEFHDHMMITYDRWPLREIRFKLHQMRDSQSGS